jgi:competence protein ComEA
MPAGSRQAPGTWLVIGLLAAAIVVAGWLRARRVLVPAPDEGRPPPTRPAWPDMRIDVNTAPVAELDLLPGVGPRLAERIVADRQAHGPFVTVDELSRVRGVGERLVDRVRPYAVAGHATDGPRAAETP